MSEFDIKKFFGKKNVLDKGHIDFFDAMIIDPKLKVVNSARVSFHKSSQTFTEKDAKLVKFLYDHGHFSTYRHSYFSFRIKAPLCVFRQWWKYQVGSAWDETELSSAIIIPETNWNEVSGRYVEFEPEFYIPATIRKQSLDNKQGSHGQVEKLESGENASSFFAESCSLMFERYKKMVASGCAKEQCRMLLPQNIYSECIWTCSLQTLVHFFSQRLKDDAQLEIREFALAIYQLLYPFMASLIEVRHSDAYTYLNEEMVRLSSD